MQANRCRAKLQAGDAVYGAYFRHLDPGVAEVLCHFGYDFLLLDGEHTPIAERDCENFARVCELTGVTPIARVPDNQGWMIGRHLDTGMQGIQVPMINTAAQALAATRAAKYAPLGTRGLAGARAANYGAKLPFSFPEHIELSNRETLVILQIETVAGIEALPEIVKTPHADIIFVGPTDLSLSLGHPGDFKHPDVQAAFDKIARIVMDAGLVLGTLASTVEATREWRARGARYVMTVFETMAGAAVRQYLEAVRGK